MLDALRGSFTWRAYGRTRVSCTALNAATVEPTWYWTNGVTFPDTYVEHKVDGLVVGEVGTAVGLHGWRCGRSRRRAGGITRQCIYPTPLIDVPTEVVTPQHPRSRGPDARVHQAVVRALLQTCASPLPVVKELDHPVSSDVHIRRLGVLKKNRLKLQTQELEHCRATGQRASAMRMGPSF
jgi:hypothetical protein